MGTLVGHVAPGMGFFLLGLWHLFNHTKLYVRNPKTYVSSAWFPSPKLRHMELFMIMLGSSMSISMELFIGPDRHQPFDPDGTIPFNHLQNFEHSSISMTFLTYAVFAMVFDRTKLKASYEMTQVLGALAFGQQLFLFHLHSADHIGVEGQYHLLLQIVIVVSLATTLLGIPYPRSFLVGFVRSASILFQGVWLVVMGLMLWTPSLIPKGCFINLEAGHDVVRCSDDVSLHRARALVNIQFSWYLIFATILIMWFYLGLERLYSEKAEYGSLTKVGDEFKLLEEDEEEDEEVFGDVEAQKTVKSFVQIGGGRGLPPIDIER